MHGSLVYIGDAQSNADKDVTLPLNAPADATLVWAPVSTQHNIEITGYTSMRSWARHIAGFCIGIMVDIARNNCMQLQK